MFAALNPVWGLRYLFSNGYASFVLGGVFLCSKAFMRHLRSSVKMGRGGCIIIRDCAKVSAARKLTKTN